MNTNEPSVLTKLQWSLPWLIRYPGWRAKEFTRRVLDRERFTHVIVIVANHYEPGLGKQAPGRVESWWQQARALGNVVRDHDDTPFRHTNFYPAEQYDHQLLELMAGMQAEGFGEVEVHLHHGVSEPDSAANTRRILEDFRDVLVEEHKCLSLEISNGRRRYAFVHGNWALANSAGGRFCGVDQEMQILADTGCYADFTLPSAPDESQSPRINAIYQCGHPLNERKPHRSGPNLKVGDNPTLPMIFTGPLVFDWHRRVRGIPIPRVDDGAMAANYPLSLARFDRWRGARISINDGPNWIFVKLYCHGFFSWDQDQMIGEPVQRFWSEVMDLAERTREFKLHFASAREAFNMVMAAIDGNKGEPGAYRNYRLVQVMDRVGRDDGSNLDHNWHSVKTT
jgi:hypothetical protein